MPSRSIRRRPSTSTVGWRLPLKEELLRRVNIAVYPARVDAVLFKEIVVQ
jgi:flagellar FliL protein